MTVTNTKKLLLQKILYSIEHHKKYNITGDISKPKSMPIVKTGDSDKYRTKKYKMQTIKYKIRYSQ